MDLILFLLALIAAVFMGYAVIAAAILWRAYRRIKRLVKK